jgi:phosphate starvation-inducible PhoH-like protein
MAIKKPAKVKRKEIDVADIISALADRNAKLEFKFKKRDYKFTDKQRTLIDKMLDPQTKVVFIDSVAGVGKTLLAVYAGLTLLKEEAINKFLYLRSVVESNQKGLGFLKGDIDEKMLLWRANLDSKCAELIEPADLSKVLASGKLEAMPINYIRGASWKDMFISIDEAQNLNYDDFKLILSRVGENSKLVICGDSDQCDIKDSGFKRICKMFDDDESKENGIISFRFEESDIVRSQICKFIMGKFRKDKEHLDSQRSGRV